MSALAIGVLFAILMFVLMLLRVPLAIAMIFCAAGGVVSVQGWNASVFQVGSAPYAADYGLSVVPLFILMAEFASRTRLARELYVAGAAFVGHWPGGLAIATQLGCAGFATISGSSLATTATVGSVAMKEMGTLRYSPALAAGSVASGGTLGILIPPSVIMVIYCVLTEQSIGRMFAAGILPGLLMTALFALTIAIWVMWRPGDAPRMAKTPFRERMQALLAVWPVVFLFVFVIGGIYLGVFTATEAAGLGAFGALVVAWLLGRMNWTILIDSIRASTVTSAMVFLIVIGSSLFSSFLAVTGITQALQQLVEASQLPPIGILLIIFGVYVILGCLMESLGMILLTVPVFFPVLMQLGYDPIWFGVLLVIMVELGLITPPVGMNLFVIRSVAPDIPLGQIIIGAIPFIIAMGACVALLIAFPEIALWLPNSLYD